MNNIKVGTRVVFNYENDEYGSQCNGEVVKIVGSDVTIKSDEGKLVTVKRSDIVDFSYLSEFRKEIRKIINEIAVDDVDSLLVRIQVQVNALVKTPLRGAYGSPLHPSDAESMKSQLKKITREIAALTDLLNRG